MEAISGENDHFSSHRMDQVEEICEDIALIDHGRLVLHGNLRQIKDHGQADPENFPEGDQILG